MMLTLDLLAKYVPSKHRIILDLGNAGKSPYLDE